MRKRRKASASFRGIGGSSKGWYQSWDDRFSLGRMLKPTMINWSTATTTVQRSFFASLNYWSTGDESKGAIGHPLEPYLGRVKKALPPVHRLGTSGINPERERNCSGSRQNLCSRLGSNYFQDDADRSIAAMLGSHTGIR